MMDNNFFTVKLFQLNNNSLKKENKSKLVSISDTKEIVTENTN